MSLLPLAKSKQFLLVVIALLLCATQVYGGNAFAPHVSVFYFGSKSFDGSIVSAPISVTYAGSNAIDGTIVAKPISVTYAGSNAIDGTIVAKPISVALNQFLGLWHMDNDWLDSSGNANHGTAYGSPAFDPQGKAATAGSFNGVSAYLDMGSSPTLRPFYAVSIEAWIKPGSVSSQAYIAGNTDETTLTGYGLVLAAGGAVQLKIGNGAWQSVTSAAALNPGMWYHVAGTYDGRKLKVYINGALDSETAASGIITHNNSFRAGYRPGTSGAGYFSGLMDELAVFGRPLSAEEIASHYRAGKIDIVPPAKPTVNPVVSPTASALLALSGTKEADTSLWIGSTRMVPLDSLTTWKTTYTLAPGVNNLKITAVDAADNQSLPENLAVIFDNQPPFMTGSVPANNSSTVNPVTSVTINLADTYSAVDLSASLIGAVVRGASGYAVNGTWLTAAPGALIFTPLSPLPKDSYTVTVYPADILGNKGMQQLTFTNHDIVPPVTTIALTGTLDTDGWYGSAVSVSLSGVDDAEGSGVDRTEYGFDGLTWTRYAAPFIMTSDGTATVYYRSVDKAGNVEKTKQQEIKINKTGIIGRWHMDNDWLDSSMFGNHGLPFNHAAFSIDAKVGTHSGSFDGVDDYTSAGLNGTTLNTLSIEMWIMRRATESKGIFQWANAVGSAYPFIYFHDSSGTLRIDSNNSYWTTTPIELNKWHHVVLTYDGSVWSFYKDGGLVSSAAGGKPLQPNAANLYFGNGYHGYWNGLMDEVTIYKRALSAAEILEHYQTNMLDAPTVSPVASPTATPLVTLSGTKPANTSIIVNGVEVCALDGLTTWQGTYTLQAGANTLHITAKDAAGHLSSPALLELALDSAAPTISGSTPANGAVVNTPLSVVTINFADAYSSINLAATANGATVKDLSGINVPGSWSVSGNASLVFTASLPFADGTYTVTVFPTDSFGNRASAAISFTCDTVAPPAPAVNAVASPTNQASQVITGSRSADTASISATSSTGAVAGAVSYPSPTTWSFTISGLQPGANTITVYAKDAAGNISGPASAVIVYDTVPPGALTVNKVASPTASSTATLSGTKDADTYLYVNGVKTTAAFADTSWTHVAGLSENNNVFTLYCGDAAGNQGPPATVQVVRDTTAPLISSATPAPNSRTNAAGTISVYLSDVNSAVDLQASLSGAAVRDGGGALVAGTWSLSVDHLLFTPSAVLTDSVYTVTLYPTDSLGNKAAAVFSFTVDATPPVVQSMTMSPDSPHKAEAVTFTIIFNEAMSQAVQPVVSFGKSAPYADYSLSGGAWIDAKTWQGTFQFTAATGDGAYTVKVEAARDIAGNAMLSAQAGGFVLDTTAPAAPTVNPVTSPTRTPLLLLSGTKPQDTALIINNVQRIASGPATAWNYTYPLSEGTNSLTFTAMDAAGNASPAVVLAVVLDTTPPLFTIDVYQTPASTATQTISGKKEPGCIVRMNNTVIFNATDMSSTWSYAITLVSGVLNRFTFTAADAMGNTTTRILDMTFDVAAPAPLGPGVLVADGSGKGTEVTLSWPSYLEAIDTAYYRVYMSATAFTDVTGMVPIGTSNRGVKTYKASGLIQGNTYYFGVVPVDTSGNADPRVNSVAGVPMDTVAPEDVTITSVTAGYDAASGNFITLKWNPSVNSTGDLADQVVYFDDGKGYDAGTSIGKTLVVYTKTGLIDATKYKFRITVKDTGGHESAGVLAEAVTRLPNPVGLTATPGNAKAALSWTAVVSPYVMQYNIYRVASATQQTDSKVMTLVKSVAPATTTYTDTGLVNDTTYQYAVTAVNTFGAERTDVASVSVKPRTDTTGPRITSNITQGQVISAPFTVNASAVDDESTVAKIELYVDGALVKTQTGATFTWLFNVVETTDGNHILKLVAYDQYGNLTEDAKQVIVSLAPPAKPVITGHTPVQISPKYIVNVAGTAPLSTTVFLRVNGVVVASAAAAGGAFTFSNVELLEGDNLLAAKASHRGGESAYSLDYKITVDTGPPPAPQNLAALALTGGSIRFTWQNAPGEIPTGYNLYMGASSFTTKTGAGVTKTNTTPITYMLKEYTPPDDTLRYYAVTALDGAGNESGISNVAPAASDRVAPTVTAIEYHYFNNSGAETFPATTAGPGSVRVVLTVSKSLRELPFFSLEPFSGSPIVVIMKKLDDTHYDGAFSVTGLSPHGPTTYKFSAKDMIGNRGSGQGTGISIDVKGPEASVQSPVTAQQIAPLPVAVSIVFDEPSVSIPLMELKAATGLVSPITGFASPDSGIHWSGQVDVSGFPEGQAEFILKGATDKLGNTGSVVANGKAIIIYKDRVPPPGAPADLTAKSGKAGVVTLNWTPAAGASSYNLYRRAAAETALTKIKTGLPGPPAQDTPPVDGAYFYSITSIGILDSESPNSAEAQAVSDRTGPNAPMNLRLSIGGSGITAVWDAPTGEAPASYNLYRSDLPVVTTSGLTPVAVSKLTQAVDASPVQSKRFYAAAALDELGNEGPVSESKEIIFPVSPVRNLLLERLDEAAPRITWQAPAEGTITGYYIYRNGSRITPYQVIDPAYTDAYYSGGPVTYGVSAVNDLGNESPIREVSLNDLTMSIPQGTILRRGLLETVAVTITSASAISIDSLGVKVGSAPESAIQGPFPIAAGSTLRIEKVVATDANALSPAAVLLTAMWSPSPGTTMKITKTVSAGVSGSGSAFEIFNEPLARGTDAKIRIKINNIGSAQMEFLTSENNGATKKVIVNLKDEDGNLLSTGYLDQRVGNAIINTGVYAVARLNPNESILTEPIPLHVPLTAPYKVVIEAAIENTYYHYNKPDQVSAPGMRRSVSTIIADTAYRAEAAPEHTFYPAAQPVLITGRAISNTPSSSGGTAMPLVPVRIGVSVKGFDRFYTATTDPNGNFTLTFTPGSNEAGVYSLWASHPDVKDRAVQSTFTIAGLSVNPSGASVRMARGRTIEIPFTLNNYGGAGLSGLTFNIQSSPGITADIINPGGNILTPGEQAGITLRLTASGTAPDAGFATVTATTTEGLTVKLDISITMVSLIPVINTTPSYIDTGMMRGNQKIETFTITNTGEETLKNARIEGPSLPWIVPMTDKTIGDITPGAGKTIGLLLKPIDTLAPGVYDDKIVIYADNHIPYTYHIQVTVTSNAVGNVLFDVLNEFMQDVPNASIVFQNQLMPELIFNVKTAADGTVIQYDLPEGRYSFNITAPSHKSYSGSFVITPGLTTTVPIALEVILVQVEWSVTPVVIEDRYQITISTTFQTNVPAPVLVTEPAGITVPELAIGQVFNGEFTVTNYGLIGVKDVNIRFPTSFGEYDIELLSAIPRTLSAMQKITVPYRITRRQAIASNAVMKAQTTCSRYEQLAEEVKGYGGSPCYTSFTITIDGTAVICPGSINERTVTKTTTYSVIVPIPGSNCSISGGGGAGGGIGGTSGSGGGPCINCGTNPTQSSGGWLPGGTPTVIEGDSCGGEPPVCPGANCPRVCSLSVVHLNNGMYEDSSTDMEIKVNGIPLSFNRTYVSRWVPVGKPLGDPCRAPGISSSGGSGSGGGKGSALGVTTKITTPMCGTDSGIQPQQAHGWTSPLFGMVRELDGGIAYFNGAGHAVFFGRDAVTGDMKPTEGAERYVAEGGITVMPFSGGVRIKDKSGLTRTFTGASIYRLSSIENESGTKVTFNYAPGGQYGICTAAGGTNCGERDYSKDRLLSITDDTGRAALSFNYDTNGYISEITDSAGRKARYQADSTGKLLKVEGIQGEISTYEYTTRNNAHLMTRKIDPVGNEVNIEYRAGGLEVTKVTAFGGLFTQQFSYDFPNRVARYTDPNGTVFKYDISKEGALAGLSLNDSILKKIEQYENGRLHVITDSSGNKRTIRYNERFDPISITDGEGNTITITYNQYWKVSQITDPMGKVTTYGYDQYGRLTSITYPDGEVVTLETDAKGNVTKATRGTGADAVSYTFQYDSRGNIIKVTDSMGNITTYGYDQYDHVNTITDPGGNIYKITTDSHGRPLTIEDPLGHRWTLTYDKKGSMTSATDELNRTTAFTYDYKGRVTSITDASGNKTEYVYDAKGNLKEVREASGTTAQKSTTATYDTSDRITSITDPMGNITRYEYTSPSTCPSCTGGSADIPTRITDPLGNVTLLSFDKNGRVVGVKDRNNNVISATYDPAGRITKITYPDNTSENYTYDPAGRLLTASNPNGTLTFTYDAHGKIKTYTDGRLNKILTYEYDKNGNRTKMTDGEGGVTTYGYNSRNLLASLTNPSNKVFTFSYDSAGRRTGLNYPNGIITTYTYDSAGQISDILSTINNTPVARNSYTYDPVGNRLAKTDLAGTHTYQYDSTYQLTQAIHPSLTEAFAYDKNGNRVTETRGTATINYTNTAGNRIQTRGTATYAHDSNGNIINKTDGTAITSYEYDYAGRLKKVTMPDGTIAQYKYDPLWRRIEKAVTKGTASTVTRYLYNGFDLLAEYDETNAIKAKYFHNKGIDEPLGMEKGGLTYYYHKDALGTITAISDSSGAIMQVYGYDSFGKITYTKDPAFIQPFTFTGREYDSETGMYYYRFRYYNPEIGQFISEDPIGFAEGDMNPYNYVGANPMNWVDPWGLRKCSGRARILQGRNDYIGKRPGGFDVDPSNTKKYGITAKSAAIIPYLQFGKTKEQMRPYIDQISATVDGDTLFDRVRDVMDDADAKKAHGLKTTREYHKWRINHETENNNGITPFIVEVYGIPKDKGFKDIILNIPDELSCPVGLKDVQETKLSAGQCH